MNALKESLIVVGFGAAVAGAVGGAIIVAFGSRDRDATSTVSASVGGPASVPSSGADLSPSRTASVAQKSAQPSTPLGSMTMPPPALVDLILNGEAAEVPGQDPRFGAYRRALEARAPELRRLPTNAQGEEIARIKAAIFNSPPKVIAP